MLRILSAGAPKTGVRLCAEAYSKATGNAFVIEFATAPKIRERVSFGANDLDVVVAPRDTIRKFEADGSVVERSAVALGSVSTGIAVKNRGHEPDLSSVDAFRNALLAADELIFNTASSGAHIANVIAQFGLTETLAEKVVRPSTGAGVLRRLARRSSKNALGFGQITEIRLKEDLGIHLVGPLPGELSKETHYEAGLMFGARCTTHAEGLLAFLATDVAKKILEDSGLVLNDGTKCNGRNSQNRR